ncbi:ribbon-helix-helix domain-containing protein [Paracraurococcus lichenis]|uniref:Type II toxin-antitoxin system ParD family antitoxin n=1 Tax=Paracraurococcus lichenis TaxID=3064888 RepID=A0ABT9DW99_9PROT|nr:type II toxin-antitoxin system ParD family antitoxin [Paracraurococcus sp. LOR1-02]MDO9708176.1 type II toxin-antitoxin system ParD family antitoxin [Paracraurococcus sp. LOR1-02]
MPGHERSVVLPSDLANYVEARVSSGAFASAEDVVRAGLEALQEQDETFEAWVTRHAAPSCGPMRPDAEHAIPPERVAERLRTRWEEGRASGPPQEVDIETLIAEERRRHAGGG